MLPIYVLTLTKSKDDINNTEQVTARFHMETTVHTPQITLIGGNPSKEAAFKAVALLWNQAYGDINRELIQLYSAIAVVNKYAPSGVKVPTESLEQLIRATSSAAVVQYVQETIPQSR